MKKTAKIFTAMLLISAMLFSLSGCGSSFFDKITQKLDDFFGDGDDDVGSKIEYCTVTFDYNDGSGRTREVSVPKGAKPDTYFPFVMEGNKKINLWHEEGKSVMFNQVVQSDITLIGEWTTYEIVTYNDFFPEVINDSCAIVEPGYSATALKYVTVKIGKDVQSIVFRSSGVKYEKFDIKLESRSTPLAITLENFSYVSDDDVALDLVNGSTRYSKVYLDLIGDNTIECDAPSGTCILANDLAISGDGSLTLFAGDGTDGASYGTAGENRDGDPGGRGANGGVGIKAGALTVTDSTLVAHGGNGGKGGNGGNGNNSDGLTFEYGKRRRGGDGGVGGNGGHALHVESFRAENATISLYGGDGGLGGNGGTGGGVSSTFSGNGGDGGNGGHGGDALHCRMQNVTILNCSSIGNGGFYGPGGAGGFDGDKEGRGYDGKNGSPGSSEM